MFTCKRGCFLLAGLELKVLQIRPRGLPELAHVIPLRLIIWIKMYASVTSGLLCFSMFLTTAGLSLATWSLISRYTDLLLLAHSDYIAQEICVVTHRELRSGSVGYRGHKMALEVVKHNEFVWCKIRGFQGDDYEGCRLLRCYAVRFS
jgi:hypothetical protein